MTKSKTKTPSDREAVIMMILVSGERYGREIRDQYQVRMNERMPLGSLYTTLDRMENSKGYLRSRYGEPVPGRRGNRRKFFKLSASGHRALNEWQMHKTSILSLQNSLVTVSPEGSR